MHNSDNNSYLSKDIWKTFWSFVRQDISVHKFEQWLYRSKNLKDTISADLYEEILMLDFSDEKNVNWSRHIIYFYLLETPLDCLCETFSNTTKINSMPDDEPGIKIHRQQQQFLGITKNIELLNREEKYYSHQIFLNTAEICRCQICGTKWLRIFEEVDCDYYLYRLSDLQYEIILANSTWPNKNWPSELSDLYQLLLNSDDWYNSYNLRFNTIDEFEKNYLNKFMYRFTPGSSFELLNKEKLAIFNWLNTSLFQTMPTEIKAFCINLFTDGMMFGMELIGSDRFDRLDPDWPCYEIWEPTQRQFSISEVYTTDHWEICLLAIKSLIIEYLSSSLVARKILERVDGIGIGFVNGDLYFISRENFSNPKWISVE